MSALVAFAYTVAEVADKDLIAAKRIGRNPDGSLWKSHYDHPLFWRFTPATDASHEAMEARLRSLAAQPPKCIVMGAPVAELDLSKPHRRWSAESHDHAATLGAVARSWLPLDIDDASVPKGLGRADRLADAALHVRDHLLPPEFRGVRMVAVPSASTGLQGETFARLRLFAALDTAYSLATLKNWGMGAKVCEALPLDPSVIQAGQPIYTSRPVFVGMSDPVPVSVRALILPGDADTVSLAVGRYAPKAAEIRARVKSAAISCGRNWRRLLALSVGGETGFFEPLTRGLASAVRAGARPEEIEGFVSALLAQRADPARRRQYGPTWVRRTIRSFQARDEAARRALAASFPNGA
jgi:hypothetical protein